MTQACSQAMDDLVNSLGRLSETAGFSRMIGQIYSLLYLSPAQLSLGEIAEKLGVSKGSVSLNTQNMERMGMIKRFNRPADRRDYYEADADFWKVIRGILRDREKKLIGEFKNGLAVSLKNVKKSASDKESKFYAERLKHMLDFLNTFSRLMNAYLALEKFRVNIPSLSDAEKSGDENEN
jgi:HTH-type transcriptional regulator, glycine betaine synthesis regulator